MGSEQVDDALPKEDEEFKTKKDKYRVLQLLGRGGYGAVFSVLRLSDSEKFAIKVENGNAKKKALFMDCNVLKGASQIKSRHFCTVLDQASVRDRFNFIVMKLIGKNLWDLRIEQPEFHFSLGTSLKVACQCLVSIEQLHKFGYLHRDIKPGNFAAGRKETNEHHTIFMLDFGLCREYIKRGENKVRMQRESAPFRGTTRYAPINSMKEVDTSRKDDIESWLYMVVEWTSAGLPWSYLKASDRAAVLEHKLSIRKNDLDIFLLNCPKKEFTRILKYVDELGFYSQPDYVFIYKCIKHAMHANKIGDADPLDWDPKTPFMGPVEEPGDGNPIDLEVEGSDSNDPDPTKITAGTAKENTKTRKKKDEKKKTGK